MGKNCSKKVVHKKRIPFKSKVIHWPTVLKAEDTKTTHVLFKEGDSVGRFCSTFIKTVLKKPPQLYCIINPSTFTIAHNTEENVLKKYKHKFDKLGDGQKSPHYQRTSKGILRVILRTMMKWKGKHYDYYKRILIFDTLEEAQNFGFKKFTDQLSIETRDTDYTQKISLSEILNKIYPKKYDK